MADQNIYVIIDGSGSMAGVKHDVVKGINDFIDEQKNEIAQTGEDVLFWLTSFDGTVHEVYTAEDLTLVNPVTLQQTYLGGGTALLDAIGKTLTNAEDTAAPRNIVVIYTDGHENQSREFTHDQIAKLIEKLEANGDWQFVYLGAEFGDFAKDRAFGTVANSAGLRMSAVNTSKRSVGETFKTLSNTASYYRGATDMQVEDFAGQGGLIASASAAGVADWDAVIDEKTKVKEPKGK